MSQARKIYEFMTRSRHSSVDKTLLLALRRAEPPYRTTLLETIIDRGSASGTSELIATYHKFSPQWQNIFQERTSSLHTGLRHAAANTTASQTNLNIIDIIAQANAFTLSDLIVPMLRNPDPTVSSEAADSLLQLAKHLANKPNAHTFTTHGVPGQLSNDIKSFHDSLALALRNCKFHPIEKIVLAAMYVIPADWHSFWHGHTEPHDFVGSTVRYLLTSRQEPQLARFCVSALRDPGLRPTAARAIAQAGRCDYITSLARIIAETHDDTALADMLKLVRHPFWLHCDTLPPNQIKPQDQHVMISFITALAAPTSQIADYLGSLAQTATESAALLAVQTIAELPHDTNTFSAIASVLTSQYESVALAAFNELAKHKGPEFYGLLIRQLSSEHQAVRDLAGKHLNGIAFNAYWKKFDTMPKSKRIPAGKAAFKIDASAQATWRNYALDHLAQNRLRAVRIARMLDRADECASTLMQLTIDPDSMVRSCAVGALGQIKSPQVAAQSEACLLAALRDSDNRVKANAVEALEQRGLSRVVNRLEQFNTSSNSRLRANAIKAQLTWKANSANQAIAKMLTDPRPNHRNSAHWVVTQIGSQIKEAAKANESENTHDRAVATV